MKTRIFTFTTLLTTCYFFANAQIQKGSILLGGGVSFANSTIVYPPTQGENKQKSQNYNISLGKAVKENTVYGINLGYGHSVIENPASVGSSNTFSTNSYSIGGYFRKYKTIAKDLYIYAEVGANYNYFKQEIATSAPNTNGDYRSYSGTIALMPGLSYKLFNKMYLEITIPNIAYLQYSNGKSDDQSSSNKQESFSFATSLNSSNIFGVGFRCIL